jgi:hypothetical protein
MKKTIMTVAMAMTLTLAATGAALATPSTQIWIPSTDIQAYKTLHINVDNYFRASGVPKSKPVSATAGTEPNPGSSRDANILDIGPTIGILPFEKIQAEIGFDYLAVANDPNDNHAFSGNFKLGTPEDSMFKHSPALAVGGYNLGFSQAKTTAPLVISGQNIFYGLAATTVPAIGAVPSLGRISAGYYHGSERALVDANNPTKGANDGVLLSWDRTMTEISDKLWLAVDYMGGNNVDGALNVGFSWAFAKNVSVIFAYDIYTQKALAGNNTFTTQLDINFP